MFRSGFENIIKGKSVIGLEIVLLGDDKFQINYVVLKKEKSLLSSEKSEADLTSFDSLTHHLDPKKPIVLIINGKGVISRKISFTEGESDTSMLNKALPNASLSDFHVQKNNINADQTFISIVRSSIVLNILKELKDLNYTNIVSCYLGPFIVNSLLPIIDHSIISNEHLAFGYYRLLIREDQISNFNFSDTFDSEMIQVGDEKINPSLVIPFAAALSYFSGIEGGITNSPQIHELKNEYREKRKFSVMSWALLLIVFGILIINYFFFNNYWSKANEITSQLALNESAVNKLDKLQKEYKQKKEFLDQNGLLENSLTSYYADQLAWQLPESIEWLDLNIHPVKKSDPGDESNGIYFQNKIIRITGKCIRSTELNGWMKSLKNKNWISDVILINYSQENVHDPGLFLMEIKLK